MVSSAALPVWEAWAVYPKQLSSLTQILPNFRCLKGAQCIWKKKKKAITRTKKDLPVHVSD